ncbi:MAG: 4Fe-4S binding protein [Methanobacteriaceae archaeon]
MASSCGCGCGVEPQSESKVENPKNPKTKISEKFLEDLELYCKELGIKSIGFVKVSSDLIVKNKESVPDSYKLKSDLKDNNFDIENSYAIVLTKEIPDDTAFAGPSEEAVKLNEKLYSEFGTNTYQISDYLRENEFETKVAHPHGSLIDFIKLAEKSGMGAIGRNGLLITPELGPKQKISAILTKIENLPILNENPHKWVHDYCTRCGKCIKACESKALIEHKNGKEVKDEFKEELCIGCNLGCTYCILKCPFYENGYEYIKERHDKLVEKLSKKVKK